MKKLIALILAVLISLTACSKPEEPVLPEQSGAQTSTEEQIQSLTETADILTEAICATTAGFTHEKDISKNSLVYPFGRNLEALGKFVCITAHFQISEYNANAIYKDYFYRSKVSGKNVTEEGIDLLLKDVFGIENHEISQSKVLEYVSMQDFDAEIYKYVEENKGCICGKIQNTEVDLEDTKHRS